MRSSSSASTCWSTCSIRCSIPGCAMTEALAMPPRSPWRDALVRLLRNHAAIGAALVLALIAAACCLVPSFACWPLDEVDWS
ncbi:MAG: hypothetical protein KDI07_25695, partial [Anaerolineae bacterium]|nr:hypothetical protein [Anaerolineae bacterium]